MEGTNYDSDQFPEKINEQCQTLFDIMKQTKRKKNKCSYKTDKLHGRTSLTGA